MLSRRALLLTAPASLAAAKDWPSFRGPNATGVSDAAGIPASWDVASRRNIAWRTPIAGSGHSSPVVFGNRIYLTTAVATDPAKQGKPVSRAGIDPAADQVSHSFHVLALEAQSGKVLWDRVVHEGVPKIKRHLKASYANPTAATNGRVVAAFFGSEGLHVLDAATGRVLWKKDFGTLNVGLKGDPDAQWGFASSPVLFEDSVIVQCDTQDRAFVAALDIGTGKQRWVAERREYPAWSTPVLSTGPGGPLLITSSSRQTRAQNARTGAEVWSFADETEVRVPAPAIAGDRVVIGGGYPSGRRFFCLDARSGRLLWNNPSGGPYTPTPVVSGPHVYVCGDNGVLGCYALADGKRIYQQRLPKAASFSASPVIADGRLYLSSEDGDIHVVRAAPEYQVIASNLMPEGIWATPAPVGKTLFVRTASALYAVRAQGS